MTTTTRTIDEALAKFTLVGGEGDGEATACVMTAISWVAGEAWTASPSCAHPTLARLTIRANDHAATTPEQRAEILRAGADGLIDTWWLPSVVVAAVQAQPKVPEGETRPDETPVDRALRVLAAVSAWKQSKTTPDLSGADLRGADLRSAVLRDANLSGANLRDADLSEAALRGADLRGANLRYANLEFANLNSAVLRGADMRYANLRYANLRYTNLEFANLRSANLRSAVLRDAVLRDANLRSAVLRDANLSDADLSDADLRSAVLRDANLRSAVLRDANLRDANLSDADLEFADGNECTVLPDGWRVDDGFVVPA